jgi:hypothetical protein
VSARRDPRLLDSGKPAPDVNGPVGAVLDRLAPCRVADTLERAVREHPGSRIAEEARRDARVPDGAAMLLGVGIDGQNEDGAAAEIVAVALVAAIRGPAAGMLERRSLLRCQWAESGLARRKCVGNPAVARSVVQRYQCWGGEC